MADYVNGNYLKNLFAGKPLSMVAPSEIINLLLHLTVQAGHSGETKVQPNESSQY